MPDDVSCEKAAVTVTCWFALRTTAPATPLAAFAVPCASTDAVLPPVTTPKSSAPPTLKLTADLTLREVVIGVAEQGDAAHVWARTAAGAASRQRATKKRFMG